MKAPEKITEPLIHTIRRVVVTTTIIAAILMLLHAFPPHQKSRLTLFEMAWSIVFCVVFVGHLFELAYINLIKLALPPNILLWYFARVVYWFLCSVPLFFISALVMALFSYPTVYAGNWWALGFCNIVIELFMYGMMQLRFKKSFYNGVY